MRLLTRLLTSLIIVVSFVGCVNIQPIPPQATLIDGQFMVKQGINIPLGKGSVSRATSETHTILEDGVLVPKEGGHFSRNLGKYLSGAAAVIIAGDYLTDGQWDAYGLLDEGSSSSSNDHCDSGERTGEKFDIKGDGNRISIHGESLSKDFTVCIDGDGNTVSIQPADPIQLLFE